MHQFELGCIKLLTPYRYKIHPKLYSHRSVCTVCYTTNIFEHRVEFWNIFQHRIESTVVFHTTSASSTPLLLGSWNLNTGTRPTESERSARVARKRASYAQRTERQRLHDAHPKRMPGALGDNTWEALVLLQVNTVCCTAI